MTGGGVGDGVVGGDPVDGGGGGVETGGPVDGTTVGAAVGAGCGALCEASFCLFGSGSSIQAVIPCPVVP